MEIVWSRRAEKQLDSIDVRYRRKIFDKVDQLAGFPSVNLDIKKMKDGDNEYRMRVGDYRVLFQVIDGVPTVIKIMTVKRRTSTTYS
ncbi:TPA: type II toxin-antitoxin system RelE/ParE family toxin [Serratia marcescens]|uniref:type II toxin-antitoxin system RelE family toxin n=1 Tax=Serratia TaxID=613 RepID=UPI0024B7F39D|nr:type II toxin-antitoxin system RelE/ParE family toxin [Serratia sp. CC22-02]